MANTGRVNKRVRQTSASLQRTTDPTGASRLLSPIVLNSKRIPEKGRGSKVDLEKLVERFCQRMDNVERLLYTLCAKVTALEKSALESK